MEPSSEKPVSPILPNGSTASDEQRKERIREIQKKLQSAEAKKARNLLATAMSNFEALKIVRGELEKKALNGSYARNNRLFKD